MDEREQKIMDACQWARNSEGGLWGWIGFADVNYLLSTGRWKLWTSGPRGYVLQKVK